MFVGGYGEAMGHANVSVALKNVSKAFSIESQYVEAVRNVDLTIESGSLTAVVGKSGAGKSTLLHIIGTLDRPTKGHVFIMGTDITGLGDAELSQFRNCTIGFVFQMNNLLAEFSALENVMLPGLIAGGNRRDVLDRARHVLKEVKLEHRLSHRPGELSGGEQQRVAIARAVLLAPPILLADEPTGNLDRNTSLEIQNLLLELCSQNNMTMLLVTHDLELAKRLPEQIVMEDGAIVRRGIA